jgi:hypothetical protein
MACPAGLINLVSHIANGTRLQKQLVLRGEYLNLFGRDPEGPFEAGQRRPAGLALSGELEERLLEAIRDRERPRGAIAARLRWRLVPFGGKLRNIRGVEPLLRAASSAVSAVVHFFRLAYADGRTPRRT